MKKRIEKSKLQEKYNCECIKCGYEEKSDKHCSELKCPKCGGQMRRKERPGPGKEKNMYENEDIQMQWDGCDSVPAGVCSFVCEDAVYFADDVQKDQVKLVGYRGEIIKHWYWGNFAIDMKGLRFDKKKTPGLIDHDTRMRLTFSKEKALDPEIYIAGPFLDNEDASKLKKDMASGFPFQASLSVRPEKTEQVADGVTVEVNGQTLKGPGAVFRKASIMEISAVVFGAFSNTESTEYKDSDKKYQFELTEKEITMAKIKEIDFSTIEFTAEQVKTEFADVYKEIFDAGKADGAKAETDRFSALKTACGEDSELLVSCFAEGLTTAEAQTKLIDKLSAGREQDRKKIEELSATQKKIDPAVTEFNNQPEGQSQPIKVGEATNEEGWRKEFESSKELQEEFGGEVEDYVSFKKAEAAGQVKILNKK